MDGVAARALAARVVKQTEIREAGGIDPLIALVIEGTNLQKEYAARALIRAANNNVENKNAIREAGGIATLIALVIEGTNLQKEYAAVALSHLANNNIDNQTEIREAGGIDPLIALVRNGTPRQKEYAASALGNLARNNDENQVEIASLCSEVFVTENSLFNIQEFKDNPTTTEFVSQKINYINYANKQESLRFTEEFNSFFKNNVTIFGKLNQDTTRFFCSSVFSPDNPESLQQIGRFLRTNNDSNSHKEALEKLKNIYDDGRRGLEGSVASKTQIPKKPKNRQECA
jgi:vacuolar protein 8